jgi:DNA primase
MIAQRSIEQVLDTAQIEEVVGDFVALKRRGTNLIGLCPFHNEKSPSFNVSPSRGIYKCFGCGEGGNSLRFIMQHEKLSYPEAIRYLARKYQIELEEDRNNESHSEEKQERESLLLLNEWACKFMETQLHESDHGNAVGLSYFKERGFSDETIRKFRLGIMPEAWNVMSEQAQKDGYLPEYLVKTGLSIQRDDGSLYDRFRNRVMFPIENISGKVIGFGGRILGNDKKQAKYVNSPESEVYNKSAVLYGIFHARKSISERNEALLVEGYTDVISLHQAGIENVVASSGTSLTQDQVKIIRRLTPNVTILYDGDAAGIKASFRGLDMILEQGMNVKIVLFPDGEDPDSFARKNPPLYVREYIQSEARNFIEFKTSVLAEEAGTDPIKRAGMIREIIASLALIPDAMLRSLYLRECARKVDMDEQLLVFELNKQLNSKRDKAFRNSTAEVKTQVSPEAPPDLFADDVPQTQVYKAEAQERDIIRVLVRYANELIYFEVDDENGEKSNLAYRAGDFILSELEADGLVPEHPVHRKVYDMFLLSGEDDFPGEQKFFNHLDETISQLAIDLCSERHNLSVLWQEMHQIYVASEADKLKKLVLEAIYSYKLRHVLHMIRMVQDQISKMDSDDVTNLDSALQELMLLQEAKRELSGKLSYVVL